MPLHPQHENLPQQMHFFRFLNSYLMPSKGKLMFLLTFFYFLYIVVFKYYDKGLEIHAESSNEYEIRKIVAQTSYLWRKFNFDSNESPSSRVDAQQLWIQKINRLPFIQNAKVKSILLEFNHMQGNNLKFAYGTEGQLKCPYAPEFETKCKLIKETPQDKTKGLEKYENIDAVIGIRTWFPQNYEPIIPPHVKRFLKILEPPHMAKNANLGKNNALLASYWKGSDIPLPYARWISNSSYTNNQTDLGIGGFQNKSKMVLALISNCYHEKNGRLKFIHELQKYIQVDVYGRCGNLICPKGFRNHECLSSLSSNYKFYLSMENSNCADYITEKFFHNALIYNMVPIVMGAHPDDYKKAAPTNSYIHVEDFKSPKALAQYLHVVSSNETLYVEYFKWKKTGHISEDHFEDFFCRVCGMLFYADFVPPPQWNSSTVLWKDVNQCLPHGQWYWNK